ncbi:MAG: helix-turn-helix domain-containing protein [Fusobacteriaceae bacterium]
MYLRKLLDNFGTNLKLYRVSKKLSQEIFLVGEDSLEVITQRSLQRFESDKEHKNFRLETLIAISDFLKVPLPNLLGDYPISSSSDFSAKDYKVLLSRNLKRYRKLKGKTQKDFSFFLNIALKTYSRLETGSGSNPRISTLAKICCSLDITFDRLFLE